MMGKSIIIKQFGQQNLEQLENLEQINHFPTKLGCKLLLLSK
jgi:hypothetical protein